MDSLPARIEDNKELQSAMNYSDNINKDQVIYIDSKSNKFTANHTLMWSLKRCVYQIIKAINFIFSSNLFANFKKEVESAAQLKESIFDTMLANSLNNRLITIKNIHASNKNYLTAGDVQDIKKYITTNDLQILNDTLIVENSPENQKISLAELNYINLLLKTGSTIAETLTYEQAEKSFERLQAHIANAKNHAENKEEYDFIAELNTLETEQKSFLIALSYVFDSKDTDEIINFCSFNKICNFIDNGTNSPKFLYVFSKILPIYLEQDVAEKIAEKIANKLSAEDKISNWIWGSNIADLVATKLIAKNQLPNELLKLTSIKYMASLDDSIISKKNKTQQILEKLHDRKIADKDIIELCSIPVTEIIKNDTEAEQDFNYLLSLHLENNPILQNLLSDEIINNLINTQNNQLNKDLIFWFQNTPLLENVLLKAINNSIDITSILQEITPNQIANFQEATSLQHMCQHIQKDQITTNIEKILNEIKEDSNDLSNNARLNCTIQLVNSGILSVDHIFAPININGETKISNLLNLIIFNKNTDIINLIEKSGLSKEALSKILNVANKNNALEVYCAQYNSNLIISNYFNQFLDNNQHDSLPISQYANFLESILNLGKDVFTSNNFINALHAYTYIGNNLDIYIRVLLNKAKELGLELDMRSKISTESGDLTLLNHAIKTNQSTIAKLICEAEYPLDIFTNSKKDDDNPVLLAIKNNNFDAYKAIIDRIKTDINCANDKSNVINNINSMLTSIMQLITTEDDMKWLNYLKQSEILMLLLNDDNNNNTTNILIHKAITSRSPKALNILLELNKTDQLKTLLEYAQTEKNTSINNQIDKLNNNLNNPDECMKIIQNHINNNQIQ